MARTAALPLHASDLQGLGRLAIDGVVGVTDLVEHLHAVIQAPVTSPERTRGMTRHVYRSVRGVTRLVGGGLDLALGTLTRIVPDTDSMAVRHDLRSALNGVLGDHLAASGNPLAIEATLLHEGRPVEEGIPRRHARRDVVVFVHGLCLHPGHWTPGDAGALEALPERLEASGDRRSLHLHYNTGRPVHENGAELADALEELLDRWPVPIERLTLVGHSMGGLVARSAAHQGLEAGQGWIEALDSIIALGSPHHGAPLERVGHGVEQLIGLSRYSQPFRRLGRVRSAGITDLRHGRILADHAPPRLPDHARLLLIAAHRSENHRSLLGDGLVPVKSALALALEVDTAVTRHRVPGCGHLALMSHPDVADHIERWIDD